MHQFFSTIMLVPCKKTQFCARLLQRLDGMTSEIICVRGLCVKFADKYVTIFAIMFYKILRDRLNNIGLLSTKCCTMLFEICL